MNEEWQLFDAKERFYELVQKVKTEGPQRILLDDENTVVVSIENTPPRIPPKDTLIEFFRNSPLVGLDIEFDESIDTDRKIEP